ncbi:TetR/AcrR family transcriptional regulator [Rhodococcoides corynebacterioides]|uniref:TetR/AcrR family transcriptional regulator n=1 Tax=Rhodococcoides corynebacterioides TaxID=53972 RepID=UPI003F7D7697
MSTRRYESRVRAQSAAQTRTDVLDAAQRLFMEQGYSSTTLQQVAVAAGVSVQTVYGQGSKASLMTAILQRAFTGDEEPVSLLARPEFAAIMEEENTSRALDGYVEFVVSANSRIADLVHAASLAADSDRSIGEELERSELRRIDDIRRGMPWFVGRRLLPPDETDAFADVLSYLTGPQTHRYFTVERRWSTDAFARWLRTAIDSHLASPPR